MPSSVPLSLPGSETAALTLRTVMPPIEMASIVTGATSCRAVGGVDAVGEVGWAHVDAGALGILPGQRHDRGAGIDHHLDRAAVDLGGGHEMAEPVGAQLDAAVARRWRTAAAPRLGAELAVRRQRVWSGSWHAECPAANGAQLVEIDDRADHAAGHEQPAAERCRRHCRGSRTAPFEGSTRHERGAAPWTPRARLSPSRSESLPRTHMTSVALKN